LVRPLPCCSQSSLLSVSDCAEMQPGKMYTEIILKNLFLSAIHIICFSILPYFHNRNFYQTNSTLILFFPGRFTQRFPSGCLKP
jgi:hypothetical protein